MEIKRIDNPTINEEAIVDVKKMGNITEVRYMKYRPEQKILKLNKDEYIVLSTGKTEKFYHKKTRAENLSSVAQSLKRLRDIINTNVSTPQNCLWETLTYAGNMTDVKRLYDDFKKFNMRLTYYLKTNHLPKHEYIVTVEPQGRGAWHMHNIIIFNEKAPFIENKILAELWGQGFVKIKRLNNIDNIGLYLTAYLGDMELNPHKRISPNAQIKEVTTYNSGEKSTKYYIKGARLILYPKGLRIFRHSYGIKLPITQRMTNREATESLVNHKPTYEKTIEINCKNKLDDNLSENNVINYRYFNKA